jgi:hypothetical protein
LQWSQDPLFVHCCHNLHCLSSHPSRITHHALRFTLHYTTNTPSSHRTSTSPNPSTYSSA